MLCDTFHLCITRMFNYHYKLCNLDNTDNLIIFDKSLFTSFKIIKRSYRAQDFVNVSAEFNVHLKTKVAVSVE